MCCMIDVCLASTGTRDVTETTQHKHVTRSTHGAIQRLASCICVACSVAPNAAGAVKQTTQQKYITNYRGSALLCTKQLYDLQCGTAHNR